MKGLCLVLLLKTEAMRICFMGTPVVNVLIERTVMFLGMKKLINPK